VTRRRGSATTPLVGNRAATFDALGEYNVLAPIARGGTAGVYLGEHSNTGERVAVKLLDPFHAGHADIVDRMFAERTVSMSVKHPNLLEVLHADRNALGLPYLVMEFLDGENLGTLAERGPVQIDAICAITTQIACALNALHAAGYIHCDVKADNVFILYQTTVGGWPRVKVIDYGVARKIAETDGDTTIAGTPAYMSPEQWRGAPTVQSDVYSLGCLLYELITGEAPFHGTLPQMMMGHCEAMAPRASTLRSDIPAALERLIMRAMAKEPGMRPSMIEMEVELAVCLRSLNGIVEEDFHAAS
jgi:serine/threonine-protein kinase